MGGKCARKREGKATREVVSVGMERSGEKDLGLLGNPFWLKVFANPQTLLFVGLF